MSDPKRLVSVIYKDGRVNDGGQAYVIPWPPTQTFLASINTNLISFFQPLEGGPKDYGDNPPN